MENYKWTVDFDIDLDFEYNYQQNPDSKDEAVARLMIDSLDDEYYYSMPWDVKDKIEKDYIAWRKATHPKQEDRMKEVTKEEYEQFKEKVLKNDVLGSYYDGLEVAEKYYSHTYANLLHITAPAHQLIVCEVVGRVEATKLYFINEDYFSIIDKLRTTV